MFCTLCARSILDVYSLVMAAMPNCISIFSQKELFTGAAFVPFISFFFVD
jgi:hypothetical protein